MGLIELSILAVALAMDAVAVSIAIGAKYKSFEPKYSALPPLSFGVFQGLMPLIGFLLGATFSSFVDSFSHYIVLIVLGGLGAKMIYESMKTDGLDEEVSVLTFRAVTVLAVATSIDALAVGATFAFLKIDIFVASSVIAIITGVLSVVGIWIGVRLGTALESKAEILGGIVLILIGIKIFAERLGWF